MGPAIEESDSTSGGIPSQTEERLPHRTAWGQQVHTGSACLRSLISHFNRVDISLSPLILPQELLKTIVLRTRRTLDEDIFLPLYPKRFQSLTQKSVVARRKTPDD